MQWSGAGKKFVKDDPKRINISAGIDIAVSLARLLGTHVGWCPDDGIVDRKSAEIAVERIDGFRHAKVDHFRNRSPFLFSNENVGGFEIPMNDPFLVGMFDGPTNPDEKLKSLLDGELALVAVIGHRIACHIFHHEIRSPFISRSCLDHGGNVRVLHPREGLSFGFEARDHSRGIHPQFEDLQGHLSLNWEDLFGEINRPAAAFTNFFHKGEGPQLFADQVFRGTRRDANVSHRRGFQIITDSGMLIKQCLDGISKGHVRSAFAFEDLLSFLWILAFKSCRENFALASSGRRWGRLVQIDFD